MTNSKLRNIPLFPLNVCLLPGEDLPLKIFEPRYKQLINDSKGANSTFGIPFVLGNKMQSYGTEVKINKIIARNSHGEMVIMVEGITNFKLIEFNKSFNDKLYSGGMIKETKPSGEIMDKELMKRIINYVETMNTDFLSDIDAKLLRPDDIAKALNLNSDEKFLFISTKSQEEKENFIRFNIDTLYKLAEQEILLNKDYSRN